MRPFKDGNPADFWHAACDVQVHPRRTSYCLGPVYPAREGWFVYGGRDERYFAIHGTDTYRVPESVALAYFPEALRQLEAQAHLAGPNPEHGKVIDAGYRAWLATDPGRKDAHALLTCLHDAWFDQWRELDAVRERMPPATLAALAATAWAQPDGQPWTGLLTVVEAESRLRVFRPAKYPYSSVQHHRDNERHTDEWWAQAKYWHGNAAGEFCYLSALLLFAAWPWLRNAGPWRWGLHVGLLPALFFLPYWLGYAYWSDLQLGLSGGVLYPSLIAHCPRLPRGPLNEWVWDRVPLLLYSCSYPVNPNIVWFQADLKAGWFRRSGPGPVTGLALSAALGVVVCGLRRATLLLAGQATSPTPPEQGSLARAARRP